MAEATEAGDAGQSLVRAAQRGDAVALARLLQQHYLYVKKYLVTVTLDRSLAEDLTQETMIRAIQRIGQFSGRSQFGTWLVAIATRLYLDTLRRHRREERAYSERAALEPGGAVVGGSGPDSDWQEVLERLRLLPRDVALPVVLKHYYGYSYEEIAGLMDLPVGTVKSRVHNGVRLLRKGLSGDEN